MITKRNLRGLLTVFFALILCLLVTASVFAAPLPPPPVPTVAIDDVDYITSSSARLIGLISLNGGYSITDHGFEWDLYPDNNPSYRRSLGSRADPGYGWFNYTITGLYSGGLYYVRAYARNSAGTAYSAWYSFEIAPARPTLSLTVNGPYSITASWSSVYGAYGYALVRSTTNSPPWTIIYSGSSRSFTDSGLSPDTRYYYRLCAYNSQEGDVETGNAKTDPPPRSNDANLSSLSVSTGVLNPSFYTNTTDYTVSVPYEVSNITIYATTRDPWAWCSGDGYKNLNVGNNYFTVTVTAEDGTKKYYYVTVIRAPASLTVSPDDIAINSDSGSANSFTITSNVSWNISGKPDWLNLSSVSGNNNQSITVTANSANLTTNSRVANLTVAGGGISRNVKVTQLGVPAYLTVSPDSLSIESTSGSANSFAITSNVSWSISGKTDWLNLSSASGSNDQNITVTANSANPTTDNRVATLTVTGGGISSSVIVTQKGVTLSNDATLSGLSISPGTLSPAFDPETTGYTASVPYDIEEITITAAANHSKAITSHAGMLFVGSFNQPIGVGSNTITIEVTAEDGLFKKTYNIVVTKVGFDPNDATLKNLAISAGGENIELDPEFNSLQFEYNASVPADISSVTIIAEKNNPSANLIGGGAYSLQPGKNEITITVLSENKSVLNEYQITITREVDIKPVYTKENTGNIGTVGRVLFDIPDDPEFLEKYTLVCDEDIDVEIYFSPKRTENAIAAGQNTYVFAVRLPNGETKEDISFSFKPIGEGIEKNKIIIYGDVNEDGDISTTDATMVTRWAGGNTTTVIRNILAADINGDAYITTTDATLVTRRAGGNTAVVFSIEMSF
jgi:hypothetical protein